LGLGPKAFLDLGNENLLCRAVSALAGSVGRILVGVPADYVDAVRSAFRDAAEVYPGGRSRQETVFKLLQRCSEPIVVIHEVTRPFASKGLVRRVIEAAREYGAAASFIPLRIPVAIHQGDFVVESIKSCRAMLSQTPQAFHRQVLERAYQHAMENYIEDQSTWELVLRLKIKVRVVVGEESNIKITLPQDWEIAKRVIAPQLGHIHLEGMESDEI
jgi:2-C-methyl-D-erythritol 4-phosphate cytidylyltransferase